MTVKPEKELRIIWYVTALIVFALSAIVILFLFLFTDANYWAMVGFSAVWLISLIITLIWVPAAYRVIEYMIEQDSVKMKSGVFWRKHVTIPNRKITNVDITQGPFERFLKLGTIHVQTAGAGGQQGQKAELRISGIRETDKIKDEIINNINSGSSNTMKETGGSLRSYQREEAAGFPGEKEILLEILETLKSINQKSDK